MVRQLLTPRRPSCPVCNTALNGRYKTRTIILCFYAQRSDTKQHQTQTVEIPCLDRTTHDLVLVLLPRIRFSCNNCIMSESMSVKEVRVVWTVGGERRRKTGKEEHTQLHLGNDRRFSQSPLCSGNLSQPPLPPPIHHRLAATAAFTAIPTSAHPGGRRSPLVIDPASRGPDEFVRRETYALGSGECRAAAGSRRQR